MKNFDKKSLFGRRDLLQGLGKGSLLFAPLLQTIDAVAQGQSPRRIILLCMPNGRKRDTWYGQRRSATDWDLHNILRPLAPYKDDMVMIRGNYMDIGSHRGDGHFHGNVFAYTGWRTIGGTVYNQLAGGPSLEFAIQRELFPNKPVLPIAIGGSGNRWKIAWSNRNSPARNFSNPQQSFDALFSGQMPPGMQQQAPVEQGPTSESINLEILNAVAGDINRLKSRLAATEREILDDHVDSLRTSIASIANQDIGSEPLMAATCNFPENAGSGGNYHQQWASQIDLIVNGFACDRTRTVSVQFDWFTHNQNPKVANFTRDSHTISHDNNDMRNQMTLQYATYVAQLAEALASRREGNGTMLDNTAIVWYSEISDGHDFRDMPCIILGSLGGKFRTGQFLELNGRDGSQNNLLVSLAQGMGWQTNVFGNPEYCSGPVPGLMT